MRYIVKNISHGAPGILNSQVRIKIFTFCQKFAAKIWLLPLVLDRALLLFYLENEL